MNVEHDVLRRHTADQLRAAVGRLPREQRQAVELAYFGGYQYPEIAGMLGIPVGTVKSRLRLALQKLRSAPEMLQLQPAAS